MHAFCNVLESFWKGQSPMKAVATLKVDKLSTVNNDRGMACFSIMAKCCFSHSWYVSVVVQSVLQLGKSWCLAVEQRD